MAEFIEVPSTALLELRYTYQGVPAENTLWFKGLDGFGSDDMGELAALAADRWGVFVAPGVVNAMALREVYVSDQSTQTGAVYSLTDDLPIEGLLIEPGVPGNVAFSIKFTTARRGRSYRGRNYAMGFARDSVVNNLLDAAVASTWVAFYNNLRTDAAAIGWTHVIASRFHAGIPRAVGLTTPVVSAAYNDLRVDTQRGRLA